MTTAKMAQQLCDELVRNDPALTEINIDLDLAELRGDDNKIQIFEALKRNKTLKRLVVDGGSLSMHATLAVAAALLHNDSLECLFLRNVDMGASFGMLALAIGQNKKLNALHLSSTRPRWTSFNDGVRSLVSSDSLEELSINVFSFYLRHCVDLANVITRNTSLKRLSIHTGKNMTTEKTIRDIAQLLRTNQSLQSLNLINISFARGEAELVAVAATGHESLERLVLESDGGEEHRSGSLTEFDVRAISTMLRSSPKLKEFELRGFDLHDEEACCLFDGLNSKSCNLEKLDITNNTVGEAGLSRLATILSENERLKQLHVNDNLIDDKCVSSLVKILNRNSALEQLHLADNNIGPNGIASIVISLASNKSSKEISVDNNPIGNVGVSALASMLKVNTTLETVSVGNFPGVGLAEWTKNLPDTGGLKTLYIYSIEMLTQDAAEGFVKALECNTVLETIYTACFDSEPKADEIMERAHRLTALNRGGRRILKSTNVPRSLWPLVLARSSNDAEVLYFFLREKNTDLIGPKRVPAATSRKRKRGDWLRTFLW